MEGTGTDTDMPMARLVVAGEEEARGRPGGILKEGITARENEPRELGEGFVSLLGQVHKGHGAGPSLP